MNKDYVGLNVYTAPEVLNEIEQLLFDKLCYKGLVKPFWDTISTDPVKSEPILRPNDEIKLRSLALHYVLCTTGFLPQVCNQEELIDKYWGKLVTVQGTLPIESEDRIILG